MSHPLLAVTLKRPLDGQHHRAISNILSEKIFIFKFRIIGYADGGLNLYFSLDNFLPFTHLISLRIKGEQSLRVLIVIP